MGQRELADEERTCREDEVGTHDAKYGGGERISPVGNPWIDHGEQNTCKRCGCCATTYIVIVMSDNEYGSKVSHKTKQSKKYAPTSHTTGTCAAINPTKTLHAIPLTNIGSKRTTTCIGP